MSHYQKLAVIVIRLIAVGVTLPALVGMALAVLVTVFSPLHGHIETTGLLFLFLYAILGSVLFALSKPLASLIAIGL
jgi:hypothetical protein